MVGPPIVGEGQAMEPAVAAIFAIAIVIVAVIAARAFGVGDREGRGGPGGGP